MKKILKYLTARTQTGIRVRLWMAVLSAIAALLIDVFYIVPAYNSLPDEVPVLFDIYGKIAQVGDKSELGYYNVFRTAFFVIMTLIACGVCKYMGNTLYAKRIRLLIVDIANLAIVTGVSMALVYVDIAKGDLSQELAEEWEYIVMLFWMMILVIEFVTDKAIVRPSPDPEE